MGQGRVGKGLPLLTARLPLLLVLLVLRGGGHWFRQLLPAALKLGRGRKWGWHGLTQRRWEEGCQWLQSG